MFGVHPYSRAHPLTQNNHNNNNNNIIIIIRNEYDYGGVMSEDC